MAKLFPSAQNYIQIQRLDEIPGLLAKYPDSSTIIAGCTSLAFKKPDVKTIIDISNLETPKYEKDSQGNLSISTHTKIAEIENIPAIETYGSGIFLQVCERLAATPLRNMITTGGNIMGGFPWSDLPVALIALDASILDADMVSRPLLTENRLQPSKITGESGILSKIIIPENTRAKRGAFIKFARTNFDFAICSVAVCYKLINDSISDIRVACGGLTPTAHRLINVEQLYEGININELPLKMIPETITADLPLRRDTRVSDQYRKELLVTLVNRAISQAAGGA